MECVVVDGASTDETPQYLADIKSPQPLIYTSAPDQGIYDAMNKGVAMAHGEYCIFMNTADTFVDPQVLTEVITQGMTDDVIYGDILKEGHIKPAAKPQNSHRMYYCH